MNRLDPHSETWAFIKGWAEEKREVALRKCAEMGLSPAETEHYRARFALAEEILALTKPNPLSSPKPKSTT